MAENKKKKKKKKKKKTKKQTQKTKRKRINMDIIAQKGLHSIKNRSETIFRGDPS